MTIIFAWLLADLLTGLVHWFEDRVLKSGSIHDANEEHHKKPTAMLKKSIWENISTTAYFTVPIAAALFWMGAPLVITLTFVFATIANVVHRFAHVAPAKQPRIIRLLQRSGLILSFEAHHIHHFGPEGRVEKEMAQINFCAMTDYLNPIFNRVVLVLNRLL